MKLRLTFILILVLGSSSLYAQVFIYGLVKGNEQSTNLEKDMYNAIEEELMSGLFDAGFVCFNGRDANNFQLETALFAAQATGLNFVLLWQYSDSTLQLSLYNINGTKYAENTIDPKPTKEIIDSYKKAILALLPQYITILRRS